MLVEDNIHERLQAVGLSDPRVTVATTAAILGSQIVLEIHGASSEVLQTVYKAGEGDTPRTLADVNSGKVIKILIRRHFPNCRINEEESGDEIGQLGDTDDWHVDPLDGTSSYARELRYSTVGIAVYKAGKPFAAAIVNPFEGELVVTQIQKGAHLFDLDGTYRRQLEVSKNSLTGGLVFVDALFNAKTTKRKLGFMAGIVELGKNNVGFRMSGSNIDQQLKVATGRAEATLTDAVGGFFDLAAGSLAIIEAGGKFTDENGYTVSESTQVAIGSNGLVHDDVLEVAQKWYRGYHGFK